MLYSDFVQLLDTSRIRAARLEAGTGRLYFHLRPQEASSTSVSPPSAPAGVPASPAAAPATQAAAVAPGLTIAGTAQAASSASPAAAAASATARMPFVRQFYIKLADKTDPVLLARIMQVRNAARKRRRPALRGQRAERAICMHACMHGCRQVTWSQRPAVGMRLQSGPMHSVPAPCRDRGQRSARMQSSLARAESRKRHACTRSGHLPITCVSKCPKPHPNTCVAAVLQSGVEYSVLRASMGTTLVNAFVGALAIWIPLLPLFYFMRRAMDSRQGTQ